MSGQSSEPRPQPERLDSFPTGSGGLLGQFSTAATSGYQPKAQMNSGAYASVTTTSTTTTNANQRPEFNLQAAQPNATTYLRKFDEKSVWEPLPPQAIDLKTNNFSGLKFVVLDGLISTMRDKYEGASGSFEWEMKEGDADGCIEYITSKCKKKRVFLITSGGLGQTVVPKIHDLPQVYAIYIFCGNVEFHLTWALTYSKVRLVCSDDDRYLLPRLAIDAAQAHIDWGNALVEQGKYTEAKEKYTKALESLEKHTTKSDPSMVNGVKAKIQSCK